MNLILTVFARFVEVSVSCLLQLKTLPPVQVVNKYLLSV